MEEVVFYIIYLLCLAEVIGSIIWAKKSRCRQTHLYERDLMYNILDKSETMVVIWKDDLSLLNMNQYMKTKLGCLEAENKKFFNDIFGINEANCRKRANEMLCEKKNIEQIISLKDGEVKYIMWRSIIWQTDKKGVRTILSIGFDITERIRLSRQLQDNARKIEASAQTIKKLAFEDELTGLYNKRKFLMEGSNLLEADSHSRWALMYLDIERFTFINSIYGIKTGDIVLNKTAEIVRKLTPTGGICCRRGDDEFAIFFKIDTEEEIKILYEKLTEEISKIQIKANAAHKLELSIGAAIYPEHGKQMGKLYENVTFVMKDIKKKKSKTLEVFTNELKERVLKKQMMAIELKKAVAGNEFVLYYQPKIDIMTEKLASMEALIRWQHPQNGFIQPDEFIPIAEQTGLIVDIGKWGLIEACLQNKKWQDEGHSQLVMSVNISAIEFYQNNMLEVIKEALEVSKLDPRYLELELTESMALMDKEQTIIKMNEIKALGVKVALDDFGTGYSSLSYLKELPIDVLKLDRSFVTEMENDEVSRNIIFTIIKLAKTLNIETVAEGVETKKQVELLKEMGCNFIQGYYFSKPLPPDLIEEIYKLKGTACE